MTTRSELVRRLQPTASGGFVCDQRQAGGELYLIEREGRGSWRVRWSDGESVLLPGLSLRSWLNARANELEGKVEP